MDDFWCLRNVHQDVDDVSIDIWPDGTLECPTRWDTQVSHYTTFRSFLCVEPIGGHVEILIYWCSPNRDVSTPYMSGGTLECPTRWDTWVSHFTTFRSCSFDQLQCKHVKIMKYLRKFVTRVMSYAFLKNDQFWIVFGLISRLLRNAHFLTCLVVWHIDLHYLILNKHPEINSKQSISILQKATKALHLGLISE